jgi:hypothetical protein
VAWRYSTEAAAAKIDGLDVAPFQWALSLGSPWDGSSFGGKGEVSAAVLPSNFRGSSRLQRSRRFTKIAGYFPSFVAHRAFTLSYTVRPLSLNPFVRRERLTRTSRRRGGSGGKRH